MLKKNKEGRILEKIIRSIRWLPEEYIACVVMEIYGQYTGSLHLFTLA